MPSTKSLRLNNMQTNTVQTLIEYVKDLSGQSNVADAKVVRWLNAGTDRYSAMAVEIAMKFGWDSRNQTDVNRATTTTSDTKLEIEDELLTLLELERLNADGSYTKLNPVDRRDSEYEALKGQTGTPSAYDLDGQLIRPLPAPDSTFTYRLTYSRAHPRYSVDNLTQSTGILPVHEEYIAFYAADRIMIGMSDSARTAVRNELTVMENNIKKLLSNRDQATPKRLKPKTFAGSNRFGRETSSGGFNNRTN